MRKCWANRLGNCAGPLTGEHLISNNLLDPKIKVKGFSWCKEELKEIGSAGLISNFLCRKHNEDLSPYDNEVKKLSSAFNRWVTNVRRFENQSFTLTEIPITYKINGYFLEKWFAKTLVNISLINEGEIKIDFDRLLPALFSGQNFKSPYGFYLTSEIGEKIDTRNFFELLPLFNEMTGAKELAGGLFTFKGFRYIILIPNSIEPSIENHKLKPISNSLTSDTLKDWSRLRVTWHHKSISEQRQRRTKGQLIGKKFKTQEILFTWD